MCSLLEMPVLVRDARKYPVLEKLETEYEVLANRWLDYSPCGFYVRVSLSNRSIAPDESHSYSVLVNSGLDPYQDWNGKPQPGEFHSQDTLGLFEERGSSTSQSGWGHGHHKLERIRTAPSSEEKEKIWAEVYSEPDVLVLPVDTRRVRIKKTTFTSSWESLLRLRQLEELDCENEQDADLAIVAQLQHLKSLELRGDHITNEGISQLTQLPTLESLYIYNGTKLTDNCWASIAQIKSLKSLNWSWSEAISFRGIEQLCKLTNLEDLSPSRGLTDRDLEKISTMVNLKQLSITKTENVTSKGIAYLTRLKNLRSLTISLSSFNDDCLVQVSNLPNLEELWFYDLPITDAGLLHLAKLRNLRYLYITGSDKITDTGLAALQSLLPGKFERK